MPVSIEYSSLVYFPDVARYRAPSGKFIGTDSVRAVIESDLDATAKRMESHARAAAQGEMPLEDWRELQKREIRAIVVGNIAAAKGGIHNLTPADWGRAGQLIKDQYKYLRAKAEKAAANPEYLRSEAFVRESASYANAGLPAYEAQRLVEEEMAGLIWEYNELNDGAHHCTPEGVRESCKQQTDKGVVRSGSLVRFGFCVCGHWCRCKRYRFRSYDAALLAYEAATKSTTKSISRGFAKWQDGLAK
jgi:hypothetical protein